MKLSDFFDYWMEGNEGMKGYCRQSEECALYDAWEDATDTGSYYTETDMATFILSKYTPSAPLSDQTLVTNQYMHDFPKHICTEDHYCHQPKEGGYFCSCPPGFKLSLKYNISLHFLSYFFFILFEIFNKTLSIITVTHKRVSKIFNSNF